MLGSLGLDEDSVKQKIIDDLRKELRECKKTLKKEQDQKIKELDDILKKTKEESEAKLAKIEKENKILKKEQANELIIHQQEMSILDEEYQEEMEKRNRQKEELKKQLEEEKKKYHALEQKQLNEFSTELTEALNRQITLDASDRVLEQFVNITKTVQDASESLKRIEGYCSNESPGYFEGAIDNELHELKELKSNFNAHFFQFQQVARFQQKKNEQNAHQEILNVCESYLQKFEESMMNESLSELCLHLPTAIENKETFEIEELRKKAEKLSEEMKITRDEVQIELEAICASDSPKEHQGRVCLELNEINTMKSMFKFQVSNIQQHMNESSANPEAVKICKNYLHELKEPMGSNQLYAICAFLQSDFANGNIKKIQSYGNEAGSLAQKLKTIQIIRDLDLGNIRMRNVESTMNCVELKD
ncbi:hypothetical protein GCK72_020763 [Caenorhabditis remanei]|uniref:Uncharacterized protein n=1 Tax=Caenorhabditis remanei TaxID=31234 RepID=A0A6A5GHP9_CAERE|nr:hypothetical protein GCK72_020763 [Caenorhabditis remanei]KAF1754203.1 hypothetical protein GCK72_020763 [Caenorhabditis remanei]